MAKNLITGGAGFIGSHLADYLIEDGQQVTIIDNLSTGSIENIEHLKGHPRFRYHIDTITNRPLLAELVDGADVIFHLAAAVGVDFVVRKPVNTIQTNIYGTEMLLELASVKGRKVILASSSELYGKSNDYPYKEDGDMVFGSTKKWRWSYACSKAIDEFLALAYWRELRLPVVIARLFNTVGPRQTGKYGMVLPRFVQQALAGGPITVYDDGQQTRCFLYVGDAVVALARLATEERAVGEVFNIGSQEVLTIKGLAEKVRQKVSKDVRVVHVPYDKAYGEGYEDPRQRVPDISKARQLIGFQPSVGIDEIIARVVEDIRARKAKKSEAGK